MPIPSPQQPVLGHSAERLCTSPQQSNAKYTRFFLAPIAADHYSFHGGVMYVYMYLYTSKYIYTEGSLSRE